MKSKAILTFDLEFWHNSQFLEKYQSQDKRTSDDYIKESIEPILNLLIQYNQKATFFVLGQVAEKYPALIKNIHQLGHEIASHGYSHQTINKLQPEEFEREIVKTNQIIEKIINQKPIGFRAPAFSLNNKTKWALKILKKHNFQYDSSIHPLSFRKNFGNYPIQELTLSLGGIYFRILPLKIYLYLTKHASKTKLPILYFHPYEFFDSAPKLKTGPWIMRKIKYWGTKKAWRKFKKLIQSYNFISIKQYLDESTTD